MCRIGQVFKESVTNHLENFGANGVVMTFWLCNLKIYNSYHCLKEILNQQIKQIVNPKVLRPKRGLGWGRCQGIWGPNTLASTKNQVVWPNEFLYKNSKQNSKIKYFSNKTPNYQIGFLCNLSTHLDNTNHKQIIVSINPNRFYLSITPAIST